MKHISKFIPILLSLLLISCPSNPSQIDSNDFITSQTVSEGYIPFTVKVIDGQTKKPILNTKIEIVSLSTKENIEPQTTNSNGLAQFNLIESNFYNISVLVKDYIPTVKSLTVSKNNNNLTIEILKPNASIIGKIADGNGDFVEGAMVQLGKNLAITDSNGSFEVYTVETGNIDLSISKIGFEISKTNINVEKILHKNIETISLKNTNLTPSILFETSKKPLGISKDEYISLFKDLNDVLIQSGFNTEFNDISSLNANTDIIVISSPSLEYSENELKILSNFVKNGKKIIVLGEWGGFGEFKIDNINKLLADANLKINQDVVKEISKTNFQTTAEQVIISNFNNNHFITKSVKNIVLYGSASVEIANSGIAPLETNITKLIGFSTSNSFRIKNELFKSFTKEQNGLIGVSNIGLGKVIAMGDVSFLTSDDSNNDNTLNLFEKDNKLLVLNIFKW